MLGRLVAALVAVVLAAPALANPPSADAGPVIVYIETDP